ncbi:LysE family translocator [Planomonospora venezuelensis]|uniref:Threonine/homoserine/homoserine lactone efflux protein n=1 Tax=Planomonospora venezuelensis TaxID=1999 RepID=A0A841DDA6_PLAVE|nr:LysE family translocator [Planomonospora venezuelensis]MBB5968060.1 threonine/homoserine/homoserine lactone efflux protein [Planomonospora venezuelensis]GIN04886.1 lysine transporter LysE [Planomonospora venezuelensis]
MFLVAFVGSCFLLAMIPGVSTAVILRQTLRAGRGPGAAATLGNETGILLWALAAAFGLSALVLASEVAYDAMRILGAGFLVVMGVQSIRQARGGQGGGETRAAQPARPAERGQEEPAGPAGEGWRRSYLLGLSTCMANPKAAVFAMSFLPQFVPEGANVPLTLVLLAVVWVLVDTVWYGLFIWTVGRARTLFGRPAVRRRLERISGVVLIGLGVRLAVETR